MIEIGFGFGLAIFWIIWFLALFVVLPFGVVSQKESGHIVEGSEPGAPIEAKILQKFVMTTCLALVVFACFYALVTSDILLSFAYF